MENITLEDILQKHFGLRSRLYLKNPEIVGRVGGNKQKHDYDPPSPEFRYWTKAGIKAYGRFTDALFSLSQHVRLHINTQKGDDIAKLIDIFNEYEYGNE